LDAGTGEWVELAGGQLEQIRSVLDELGGGQGQCCRSCSVAGCEPGRLVGAAGLSLALVDELDARLAARLEAERLAAVVIVYVVDPATGQVFADCVLFDLAAASPRSPSARRAVPWHT
jgi:hypothetical protein